MKWLLLLTCLAARVRGVVHVSPGRIEFVQTSVFGTDQRLKLHIDVDARLQESDNAQTSLPNFAIQFNDGSSSSAINPLDSALSVAQRACRNIYIKDRTVPWLGTSDPTNMMLTRRENITLYTSSELTTGYPHYYCANSTAGAWNQSEAYRAMYPISSMPLEYRAYWTTNVYPPLQIWPCKPQPDSCVQDLNITDPTLHTNPDWDENGKCTFPGFPDTTAPRPTDLEAWKAAWPWRPTKGWHVLRPRMWPPGQPYPPAMSTNLATAYNITRYHLNIDVNWATRVCTHASFDTDYVSHSTYDDYSLTLSFVAFTTSDPNAASPTMTAQLPQSQDYSFTVSTSSSATVETSGACPDDPPRVPGVTMLSAVTRSEGVCTGADAGKVRLTMKHRVTWKDLRDPSEFVDYPYAIVGPAYTDVVFNGLNCYGFNMSKEGWTHEGCVDAGSNALSTCSATFTSSTACFTALSNCNTFRYTCLSNTIGDSDSGSPAGEVIFPIRYDVLEFFNATAYPANITWKALSAAHVGDVSVLRCGESTDIITSSANVRSCAPIPGQNLNTLVPIANFLPSTTAPLTNQSSSWNPATSTHLLVTMGLPEVGGGITYAVQFDVDTILFGVASPTYTPSLAQMATESILSSFYAPRGAFPNTLGGFSTQWQNGAAIVCGSNLNCDTFGFAKGTMGLFLRTHPEVAPDKSKLSVTSRMRYYIYRDLNYEAPFSHAGPMTTMSRRFRTQAEPDIVLIEVQDGPVVVVIDCTDCATEPSSASLANTVIITWSVIGGVAALVAVGALLYFFCRGNSYARVST